MYPASHVDRLAKMPTREQALSMLLGVMKAPVQKLVRTLNEPAPWSPERSPRFATRSRPG